MNCECSRKRVFTRSRLSTFGAVALALTVFTVEARAFELFGIRFFGSDPADEEELGPDAQPYVIEVQVRGDDDDLERRVRNASRLYADREETPLSTAAFLARGRGDYQRILAALYAEGRYGGVVDITVGGRPVEELAADIDLPDPVPVTVTVDPGPLFTFGHIGIEGAPSREPEGRNVPDPPSELGLVPGGPARSGIVLQSENALVSHWRHLGHPKARIAARDAVAQHPTNTLDVGIAVQPGPWAVFGPVSVTGTEDMDPNFVAWYTAIRPGEPFHPDDIERAREQMRRLETFQSVRIVEADEILPDGSLPLTVAVAERPRRVYGVGASYSSLDGAGFEGYWQHRNLFGRAERLRLEGRVGGIGGTDVAEYDYFTGATFVKPGVITPFTDLTAQVLAKQENPDSYKERTAAARVGLAHRFFEELEGRIGANIERSRIEDPFGTRDFLLASIPTELIFDNRDDELNPTEGFRVSLRAEPFNEFEFSNTGLISRARASTYFALDEDARFVLAARATVGSIVGAPRDELPASRLFFGGGGDSIRGYAYRNVGPRLETGEVVGGRSYFDASLELRAQVTDSIGVVPFVDIGSAFESSFPDFSEDVRVGAGLGLRYFTGLGPLRLDVAFPLDRQQGDPSAAFYIGIGQSF